MKRRVLAVACGALLAAIAACGIVAPGSPDAAESDATVHDAGRLHAVFDAVGYQHEHDIHP